MGVPFPGLGCEKLVGGTYRAGGHLHHGIQPALRGVEVAGDALLAHLGLKLPCVAGELQHVPEGEGWLAGLLLAGAGVLQFLGVRVHKGEHRLVHKRAEAWGRRRVSGWEPMPGWCLVGAQWVPAAAHQCGPTR